MTLPRASVIACTLIAVTACKTSSTKEDVPALITDPTPAGRAELAEIVSEALHGAPVTLADDALTKNSLLIIQRNEPRDVQGRPISGRDLGQPEHFQLVTSDSRCVLIHHTTGKRYPLSDTTCVAE